MADCPFCSIPIERPHEIIAQNDHCYLLNNPEGSLGRGMLIMPYRHVETPFDLSMDEWAAIRPLMIEAQARLDTHDPDGFNLGWNVGRVGGQEVSHVHFHVFARFGDEPFAGKGIRRWFKSEENQRPKT